jgi:hypothetical protein
LVGWVLNPSGSGGGGGVVGGDLVGCVLTPSGSGGGGGIVGGDLVGWVVVKVFRPSGSGGGLGVYNRCVFGQLETSKSGALFISMSLKDAVLTWCLLFDGVVDAGVAGEGCRVNLINLILSE